MQGGPRTAADRDRRDVERQLGRPPRALRRVAVRCPYGRPAVTEQYPYDAAGEPFPTTYYLTCPHAVAVVARAEAGGGVEGWSERVAGDAGLADSLERASERQRAVRRTLARGRRRIDDGRSLALGIAGSSGSAALKCLHAHIAFALADGGYELGGLMIAELPEPLFPEHACCLSPAAGRDAAPGLD